MLIKEALIEDHAGQFWNDSLSVQVEEGSVSVVLLAGGVGKRMGVRTMSHCFVIGLI